MYLWYTSYLMALQPEQHDVRSILQTFRQEVVRVPGVIVPKVNIALVDTLFGSRAAPIAINSLKTIHAFADGEMVVDNVDEHFLRHLVDLQRKSRNIDTGPVGNPPTNQLNGNLLAAVHFAHNNLTKAAQSTGNSELHSSVATRAENYSTLYLGGLPEAKGLHYRQITDLPVKMRLVTELIKVSAGTLSLFS